MLLAITIATASFISVQVLLYRFLAHDPTAVAKPAPEPPQ